MKKFLVSLVLFGICNSSFAFLTQSNWRWRNNDGTETSATWKAAQNQSISYSATSEVIRLRLEIYNTNKDAVNLEDSLQYTTTPNDDKSWKNILKDDETRAFVMARKSSTIDQDVSTTSHITGNAYAFVAGKAMVDSAVLKLITIPGSNRSEFEWAIRGTANTLPNTTYYFKQWGSTANNLPPGVTFPSLTTAIALPISLSNFSLSKEGSKVKLQWSTASEQNNDKFEVEKSSDAKEWRTIATVKGNGTSSQAHNYISYDESPLNGINYYRLRQVDLDGRFNISEVKTIRFDGGRALTVTVSPNPARGMVNFKLNQSIATNVLAVLTDANGKVVYKETFKNVQANTNNKLNFKQQPTGGIYILKLQGEGVSETIKVVME